MQRNITRHAHTHSHIHTLSRDLRMHTCTYSRNQKHFHAHTCNIANTHTCTHTRRIYMQKKNKHMRTLHIQTRLSIYWSTNLHSHTLTHSYIHLYIHALTHILIYGHIFWYVHRNIGFQIYIYTRKKYTQENTFSLSHTYTLWYITLYVLFSFRTCPTVALPNFPRLIALSNSFIFVSYQCLSGFCSDFPFLLLVVSGLY